VPVDVVSRDAARRVRLYFQINELRRGYHRMSKLTTKNATDDKW
jgi:hypothetical protein